MIIATNQGGIAKGWYTLGELNKVHNHLICVYRDEGIELADIYFCPHHPLFTGDCDCRKPKPGKLLRGIEKFNLDASTCYFICDKTTDVEAAPMPLG